MGWGVVDGGMCVRGECVCGCGGDRMGGCLYMVEEYIQFTQFATVLLVC